MLENKYQHSFKDGKGFNLFNIDIYTKGDLKGYISGMLETEYNDREYEFLYRFNDEENGKNYQLVSVDYGYEIPLLENHFDYIERVIFNEYLRNKNITIES